MKIKKFKKWLKDERLNKSLSQSDLAKELGISIYTINNLEQGKTLPNLKNIKLISQYFETPVEEIRKMMEEQ